MKKLSTFILTLIIAASAAAQVKMDMVLNPTPPANLGEWGNRREVLTVIISPGPAGGQGQFKIKVEITASDGTIAGTNDLTRAPIFGLQTVPQIFTAADVMPIENMIFAGKYKSSLDKTGKLPSDNYTLCLTPVRPVDLTPMAPPVCKPFFLAATQLPTLMKPYDAEILDGTKAKTAIIFRWTPVIPRQTDPVTYRIQVFEIREFQTPMQALRANQPLLDQQVAGVTQYIWRPQMDFYWCCKDGDVTGDEKNINTSEAGLGSGKDNKSTQKNINTSEAGLGSGKDNKNGRMPRFIWTIQTLDSHGDPITRTDGNGEARSEPIMFFVQPPEMKAKEKANRTKAADISAMQYVTIKIGGKKFMRISKDDLVIYSPKILQCFCPDDPINPVDCENLGEICFNKPDPFTPADPWWETETGKKEWKEINNVLQGMGMKLKVKEKGR